MSHTAFDTKERDSYVDRVLQAALRSKTELFLASLDITGFANTESNRSLLDQYPGCSKAVDKLVEYMRERISNISGCKDNASSITKHFGESLQKIVAKSIILRGVMKQPEQWEKFIADMKPKIYMIFETIVKSMTCKPDEGSDNPFDGFEDFLGKALEWDNYEKLMDIPKTCGDCAEPLDPFGATHICPLFLDKHPSCKEAIAEVVNYAKQYAKNKKQLDPEYVAKELDGCLKFTLPRSGVDKPLEWWSAFAGRLAPMIKLAMDKVDKGSYSRDILRYTDLEQQFTMAIFAAKDEQEYTPVNWLAGALKV